MELLGAPDVDITGFVGLNKSSLWAGHNNIRFNFAGFEGNPVFFSLDRRSLQESTLAAKLPDEVERVSGCGHALWGMPRTSTAKYCT